MKVSNEIIMSGETRNLDTARRFLKAIEASASGDAAAFYASDVVAECFPHKLAPKGMTTDLAALHASSGRGKQLMVRQS